MSKTQASTATASRGSRRARPRRWRGVLFPVLAALLGLTAAWIVVEIGLRVVGFEPTRMLTKRNLRRMDVAGAGYHCYPSNPDAEFNPLPDLSQGEWGAEDYGLNPQRVSLESVQKETPFCVPYNISKQGYRDRDYEPAPPAGVVRIALIGDSFVFGEGVQQDGTLPVQLGKLLGPGYEVVNCGHVGAGTDQEMSDIYEALVKLQPQRVLVCFLVNDVTLTDELIDRQEFINDFIIFRDTHLAAHQKRKWYLGPSLLLRWAGTQRDLRVAHRDTLQWYLDSYDPKYNDLNLQKLALNLLELTTLPHCQSALVMYPLLENLEGVYPLASIHDLVRQMALDVQLPAFDLEPSFVGQQSRSLWAHDADHHPNRKAHGIAARSIADWLQRDLPQFLAPPVPEQAAPPAPDDPAVGQAMQLMGQGQYLPARRLLLQALRRTPQSAAARAAIGYLSFLEGRMNDAIVHYEEALRLRPDWADIEINLAAVLASQPDKSLRDPDRAIALAEKACRSVDPTPLPMLDTLILTYGEAGRLDEAVAKATAALARAEAENRPAAAAEFRKKLDIYSQQQAEAAQPPTTEAPVTTPPETAPGDTGTAAPPPPGSPPPDAPVKPD